MNKHILRYVLSAFVLLSMSRCKDGGTKGTSDDSTEFPRVKKVENTKGTNFVAALTAETADSNIIYSPTFLFAWDELRHILGSPLNLPHAVKDLQLVNSETTFKEALAKGDYETQVNVSDGTIDIIVSFEKALPFLDLMDTAIKPFLFGGIQVKAFGLPYFNEKTAAAITILFYENDVKFIIGITPRDKTQEIVLAKGFNDYQTLEASLEAIDTAQKRGQQERAAGGKFKKRYEIEYDDQVLIPVLRFNLEKEFRSFIGAAIVSSHGVDTISKAKQRTAFVLDENGGKVESVAEVAASAAAAPEPQGPEEIRRPKMLWLNKPYITLLRKKGIAHPYLMVKVSNAELMVKR